MEIKRICQNAALALVSVVVLLLILEVIVRTFLPQYSYYPRHLYISDEDVGYRLNPNFEGELVNRDFKVHYQINSDGLRGGREYSESYSSNRVMALGDSFTFGNGVEFDDVYTSVLESAGNLEVINAGVPGYSTLHELNWYKKYAGQFEHNLVILLYYDNDFDGNLEGISRSVFKGYLVPSRSQWKQLQFFMIYMTEVSQLFHVVADSIRKSNFLYGLLRNSEDSKSDELEQDKIDKNLQILIDLNNEVKRHDASLVVFFTNDKYLSKLAQSLIENRIEFAGLGQNFAAVPLSTHTFAHDIHWNARGHEIAGNAINSYLRGRESLH